MAVGGSRFRAPVEALVRIYWRSGRAAVELQLNPHTGPKLNPKRGLTQRLNPSTENINKYVCIYIYMYLQAGLVHCFEDSVELWSLWDIQGFQ